MTKTDAINLLCACPVGGPPGETTLGDAIQRLHRRSGVRVALAAIVELIDCRYLEHQSRDGVAYVAADTHWHETARRTLADHPSVLEELGVALPAAGAP